MKRRLLEWIRCTGCHSSLDLAEDLKHVRSPGGQEVMSGTLLCSGCGQRFPIRDGIPRLLVRSSQLTQRTAKSYGYLWSRSFLSADTPTRYHFDRMARTLSIPPLKGLILDAGCGPGIDLANQARSADVEVIGVELSEGGCRSSFQRASAFSRAHVVQADLTRLPFADGTFDLIYSYGVLHHLRFPSEGVREIARVVKPSAPVGAYLYEDFSDRAAGWRWLLQTANQFRRIGPHLPNRLLYLLCQLASPIVFLLFAVPFKIFQAVPWLRSLGADLPFRHATGPLSLVGDLYDRFSAPTEWRYSKERVAALFQQAGFQQIQVAKNRGWMVWARKKAEVPAALCR